MNTTCQQCGEDCDIWQEVRTSYSTKETEIWCYCKACDMETFHPMPEPQKSDAKQTTNNHETEITIESHP